jgi:hypothetical protein
MALPGWLTCTVKDYKQKSAVVKVKVTAAKATMANAKTLAETLEDLTCAAITGYGAIVGYSDSAITGKYDRVLQKLELLYQDASRGAHRFSIPAPKDGNVNDDQECDSDVAEDIRDMLNGFGLDIPDTGYNGSGLKSRLPGKDARATELTGV